jgi:hypothetical protein
MKKYLLLIIILIVSCNSINQKSNSNSILNNIDGEPVIPRNANKLYITLEKNSQLFSKKLLYIIKQQIRMNGRLALVNHIPKADISLIIKILLYQIQPIKYDNFGHIETARIRIVVSLKLIDLKKKKLILYDPRIEAFKQYSTIIFSNKNNTQILEIVLNELANRIVSKSATGWYTNYLTNIEKRNK